MPKYIAEMTINALNSVGKVIRGSKILIMGLTYKEDVADIRETPVKEIIKELQEHGVEIFGYDPLLDNIEDEFGIKVVSNFEEIKVDGVILTVAHEAFHILSLADFKEMQNDNPILIDVRGVFDAEAAKELGFCYKTL